MPTCIAIRPRKEFDDTKHRFSKVLQSKGVALHTSSFRHVFIIKIWTVYPYKQAQPTIMRFLSGREAGMCQKPGRLPRGEGVFCLRGRTRD